MIRVEGQNIKKIVERLKQNGWKSEDDVHFCHDQAKTNHDTRIQLWQNGLLTTTKARITIVA